MPAQWTGRLIGEMHVARITARQLAAEAGWNARYLSTVLNGHREPKKAEETLSTALARLIAAKKTAPADEGGGGERGG